jgi:hypothetical protein
MHITENSNSIPNRDAYYTRKGNYGLNLQVSTAEITLGILFMPVYRLAMLRLIYALWITLME